MKYNIGIFKQKELLKNGLNLNDSVILEYIFTGLELHDPCVIIPSQLIKYNPIRLVNINNVEYLRRKILSYNKFLQYENLPPQKIKDIILINKEFDGIGIGNKKCPWCEVMTFRLSSHHYPVPKRDGGKDVIEICLNCHYEYHFLEKAIVVKGKEKFDDLYIGKAKEIKFENMFNYSLRTFNCKKDFEWMKNLKI